MQITKVHKIHFIGIGGIGMSALARLFLHEGKEVSGSDRNESDITKALEKEGVEIFRDQVAENISSRSDLDLVVYTEAMPKDHPEMLAAKSLGIPMMNYFEALGEAVNNYHLIAVAGTHGKTTTTAMLTDIFERADLDPTAIIGSLRSKTKSNFRAGKGKHAIVEACEYKRDFLTLEPDVLVITNVELEHVDYYKSLYDVQSAFREIAEKVPENGVVICDTSDENVKPIIQNLKAQVIDYKDYLDLTLSLKQPGLHNLKNAAAALAVADTEGIDSPISKDALQNFAGTWRRFEYKGEVNGAPVYDDYGHHPTEIMATLQGTRDLYPDHKVVLVFQPHTYSRLKDLFDGFVEALGRADRVLVAPVYAAREADSKPDSQTLAMSLKEAGIEVLAPDTLEEIVPEIRSSVTSEDVVLVMGAGDVTKIATKLVG